MSASAVALVLLVAAVGKLRAPEAFREALSTAGWIPSAAHGRLVRLVPASELVCGVMVFVPTTRTAGALGAGALMLAFTFVLGVAFVQGRAIDCGCLGGRASRRLPRAGLARNVVLLALISLILSSPAAGRTLSIPAVLSGVGVGLLLILFDQLVAVMPSARVEIARGGRDS